MQIALHAQDHDVWSFCTGGITVLFQSLDGPGELLRLLADLSDEAQPVSEQEWEQARRRLVTV